MALLEHSEDIFTGMKVVDAGYRVDYLPLPLAAGSTPDNTAALASQQYRWARGNFALAGTPLFKRMRLHPMQRLGLWDGWIFYVTSALSPLVALFVPVVSLAQAPEAITLAPSADGAAGDCSPSSTSSRDGCSSPTDGHRGASG